MTNYQIGNNMKIYLKYWKFCQMNRLQLDIYYFETNSKYLLDLKTFKLLRFFL